MMLSLIISMILESDIYRRFPCVEAPASYWSRSLVPAVDYPSCNINCSSLPPFVHRRAVCPLEATVRAPTFLLTDNVEVFKVTVFSFPTDFTLSTYFSSMLLLPFTHAPLCDLLHQLLI